LAIVAAGIEPTEMIAHSVGTAVQDNADGAATISSDTDLNLRSESESAVCDANIGWGYTPAQISRCASGVLVAVVGENG